MKSARIPLGSLSLAHCATMVAFVMPASADPRFQLLSETWTSLAGGGQSGTYTAHVYDGDGRRIRTEIHSGSDGSGGIFERREYSYRADGLLEIQINYQGTALESRILHRYDAAARVSEKVVEGGDGRERFRDSFAYDGQGRILSETRWMGELPASMHRLSYAADGSLSSDSLFEPEAAGLVPVQAALHGAGRAPGETRESRWRKQEGSWYHVQDIFRLHASSLLVASSAYQVGGRRLDSSACAYDGDGNRVLEERFDGAGRPLSRLVFRWRDSQPVTLRRPVAFRSGEARGSVQSRKSLGAVSHALLARSLPGGIRGAGWHHDGMDLLGRPRHQGFAALGRE